MVSQLLKLQHDSPTALLGAFKLTRISCLLGSICVRVLLLVLRYLAGTIPSTIPITILSTIHCTIPSIIPSAIPR